MKAPKQDRGAMVEGVLRRDFRSVARMITLVENDAPEAAPCLRSLFPHAGKCFTIGITGAPGSGKSTLVDQLAARYREDGKTVGVIAVDPTSPFSGGAILGDRIRMQSRGPDPGIFIRSMATRGHLGGLARAANDALTVLDAAGFDVILIETVGVGQDEVEIVRTANATIVLLVPGMGDDIQAMKAGLMEIGDIFVINKSDHAGVERVEAELRALLSMSHRPDQWTPLIIRTVAFQGEGIEECAKAIAEFREFLQNSSVQKKRSLQIQRERMLESACSRIMRELSADAAVESRIDELALEVSEGRIDPCTAPELLLENSSRWLRKSPGASLLRNLDHVGIAVRSIASALEIYQGCFGLKPDRVEDVAAQKTRVTSLPLGETRIELLEGLESDSPVSRFIEKRGEGLHHLCFAVDDLAAALEMLKMQGVRLIDEKPRQGADGSLIAFLHPSSIGGILIELIQVQKMTTNIT